MDGIYYYNARFYNADIGRFLQPDTIVPEPGNPQALNRYSYVLNNPINHSDPTGHCIAARGGECAPVPPGGWDSNGGGTTPGGSAPGGGSSHGGDGGFSDSYDSILESVHKEWAKGNNRPVVWYSRTNKNGSVHFRFETRRFYYHGGGWECEKFVCLPVYDPDKSGKVRITGSLSFFRSGKTEVTVTVDGIEKGPRYPVTVFMESGAEESFFAPNGNFWSNQLIDQPITTGGASIDQSLGEPTRIEVDLDQRARESTTG